MSDRIRPLTVYAAFFVVVALAAGVASYVYKHEPPRDVLEVRIEPASAPKADVVSGSITAIDGNRLTLATPDGSVTVELPPGVSVEELLDAGSLPEGTQVNVGVEDTEFGRVLTGIVAIGGRG